MKTGLEKSSDKNLIRGILNVKKNLESILSMSWEEMSKSDKRHGGWITIGKFYLDMLQTMEAEAFKRGLNPADESVFGHDYTKEIYS